MVSNTESKIAGGLFEGNSSQKGGGIWNCATGHTTIHINKGLAIFDNIAPDKGENGDNKGAGDDFVNLRPHLFNENNFHDPTNPKVSISSRMLGGGERLWYQDGSLWGVHNNLAYDRQWPRFNPKNPGTPIPYDKEIDDHAAFKSVPSDESKKLAEALASVIFEGNVATGTGISGGAITNNGELIFGEPKPYELTINKKWNLDNEKDIPDSISLELYIGKYKLQDIVLTKENKWTITLKDFPDPETLLDPATGQLLKISLKEKKSGNYIFKQEDEVRGAEKLTYTINLSNSSPPDVPPPYNPP